MDIRLFDNFGPNLSDRDLVANRLNELFGSATDNVLVKISFKGIESISNGCANVLLVTVAQQRQKIKGLQVRLTDLTVGLKKAISLSKDSVA